MPADEPDLYAILGVAPDASPAHIAHAYRRLIRAGHPDHHPHADTAALRTRPPRRPGPPAPQINPSTTQHPLTTTATRAPGGDDPTPNKITRGAGGKVIETHGRAAMPQGMRGRKRVSHRAGDLHRSGSGAGVQVETPDD